MKTNDKVILDLKKKVEEKKKLLKSTERFNPKTNCALRFNGENYNLNVIEKPTILLLLAKFHSLNVALRDIYPEETLEISGYSISTWIEDLKSRFNTLNRRMEEDRLKVLEDKLHNLLSVDTKIELEIENLKSQI